jgi:DNA mismatch repair protein MutS
MGLIDDYFKIQHEYEQKYGDKTVILYQKGSFYNIFEYDPANSNCETDPKIGAIGYAGFFANLLTMNLHLVNGNHEYSYTNPHTIGFPCIAYEKYRDPILSAGFTIIRVSQCQGNTKGKTERFIEEISSPATDIRNIASLPITNNIISIYIECQKNQKYKKYEDYLITCGISCIDISTGKSIIGEVYSKISDEIYAIHEMYRFIGAHNPRELIINVEGLDDQDIDTYKEFLSKAFELKRYESVSIHCNKVPKDYVNVNYQKQMLLKVFSPETPKVRLVDITNLNVNIGSPELNLDNILYALSLESYAYGRISFIFLLQYCYEHDETIIKRIDRPNTTWIDGDKHLMLMHNSRYQLDIFPRDLSNKGKMKWDKSKTESLFTILDNNDTVLGQRYLINMLSNPITDEKEIESHYDMIQEMIESEDLRIQIDKNMKGIPDIERYHQLIRLKRITPLDLNRILKTYVKIVTIFTEIYQSPCLYLKKILLRPEMTSDFNGFLTYIFTLVDLDKLNQCRLGNNIMECDESFIRLGQDILSDQYQKEISNYELCLKEIVQHLNSFLAETRGKLIELESISPKKGVDGGEYGLALLTTQSKAKILRSNLNQVDQNLCGELKFITFNKSVLISSDKIESICGGIQESRDKMRQYLYTKYTNIIDYISSNFKFYGELTNFMAKLDFIKSNAKTAIKNKYYRPQIVKSEEDDPSFCHFDDLRHPIVEKIIESQYISNTISLGIRENMSQGLLLYGINGIGKTVLTKAIGLNLIMAQACCYTPSKMTYRPYRKIITRLNGGDDMYNNQSSFQVEMSELRTILRNYDHRTLVLGDELCRGTENYSGSGLSAAAILYLIKARSSFIFSTHMHHLIYLEDLKTIPSNILRIAHLSVSVDPITRSLIYDRKMKDGAGESIYGIEVAKSLNMDPEFIKLANKIRREVMDKSDKIFSTQTSRYNSKIYIDSCSICGKESPSNSEIKNLQTHHIREQKEADKNGFIDDFHKNRSFNLLVICEECHTHIHKKQLQIQKNQTPSGSFLSIKTPS